MLTFDTNVVKILMGDAGGVDTAAVAIAIEDAEKRWHSNNTFLLSPMATPKIPACFRLSFMETDTGMASGTKNDDGASGGASAGLGGGDGDELTFSMTKKANNRKRKRDDDEEAGAMSVELATYALRLGSEAMEWLICRLDALTREGPDMARQVAKVDELLEKVKEEARGGNATTQLSAAVDESKIYHCKYKRCGNIDPMQFATDKRLGQIACQKCGTVTVSRLAHEGQEFRNFSDKPSRNTQGPTHNSMFSLSYNTSTRVSVPSTHDSSISQEAAAALSRSNQAMHANEVSPLSVLSVHPSVLCPFFFLLFFAGEEGVGSARLYLDVCFLLHTSTHQWMPHQTPTNNKQEHTDGSDNRRTRQIYKDQHKKKAETVFQEVASSLQISEAICKRALLLFAAYRDRVETLRYFDGTLAACMINAIREGDTETTAAQDAERGAQGNVP